MYPNLKKIGDPIASIFVVDSPHAAESLPNTHPPKTPSFLHQFPAFSLQTTSIVPGYIRKPKNHFFLSKKTAFNLYRL